MIETNVEVSKDLEKALQELQQPKGETKGGRIEVKNFIIFSFQKVLSDV